MSTEAPRENVAQESQQRLAKKSFPSYPHDSYVPNHSSNCKYVQNSLPRQNKLQLDATTQDQNTSIPAQDVALLQGPQPAQRKRARAWRTFFALAALALKPGKGLPEGRRSLKGFKKTFHILRLD